MRTLKVRSRLNEIGALTQVEAVKAEGCRKPHIGFADCQPIVRVAEYRQCEKDEG
jgi:hypothetical protein